ncbi:MAG: prop effector [Comamonadaceae bacterium]|nr:MAG: prop effector [Comamonadaceae bacterium]
MTEPEITSEPALAATAAPAASGAPAPKGRRRQQGRPQPQAAGRAPARAPSPVLERLFELYPKMFGARFLPLKLGVYQELLALHGEEFKKEDLKLAMGQHARSTRYLESVAAGEKRHDLQGEPVEDVSPEHVQQAIFEVYRRRKARSKEDPRAWLLARLEHAIDQSGLDREAWDARVGTTDDFSVAALDEAFAVVREKVARREALRRAFEASGLGVDEFASMYGMDPDVVKFALSRAAARPA